MKRILLLILLISTFSFANGQLLKSIGIKGGMSIAGQEWNYKTYDSKLNKDSRNGFYGAVSLEFLQSKYFSFATDLGYCAKGSTEKVLNTTNDLPEDDGTYKTYDTKFNYLTISPILKVKYEFSRVVPYVLLGMRLDYQLSYTSDFNYEMIEQDFQKAIFGANFGAGIEYKIKKVGLFAEGQYQHDFTKVMDTASSQNKSGVEIINNAIIACIGLKYYLIKNEANK